MSGQYRWTDEGLYVCIRCGTGLEPGHNRRCRGKKLKKERKTKISKTETDERIATDLAAGFDMIHASEQ